MSASVDSVRRLAALGVRQAFGAAVNMLKATDGRDVLLNSPDGWEVEQPWMWWLGPNGGGSGGPFGNPIPGSGLPFGSASASGMPAVARCTSLIVDTLAGLPWNVRRGTETLPTPDWITDPQALRLDNRVVSSAPATVRMSNVDFWAQWLTSALWLGDGYLYVPSRSTDGAPQPPLYILHPDDVEIRDGGTAGQAGTYYVSNEPMPPEKLIHLRGLEPIRGGHGSGVLRRFAYNLGLAGDIRDYASGVFHSGVPSGYLKSNQPKLDKTQAEILRQSWMEKHGGSQRSIAILNATTEFHPLTFSPVDAQLIDMFKLGIADIAMMFGVPPYMLGIQGDSTTYANIESRMTELTRFTLMPWARRVEATLDAQFPRGTSLKVGFDALLRADTKTRYETYQLGINAGIITVDEARALEDRPPLGGGANGNNEAAISAPAPGNGQTGARGYMRAVE